MTGCGPWSARAAAVLLPLSVLVCSGARRGGCGVRRWCVPGPVPARSRQGSGRLAGARRYDGAGPGCAGCTNTCRRWVRPARAARGAHTGAGLRRWPASVTAWPVSPFPGLQLCEAPTWARWVSAAGLVGVVPRYRRARPAQPTRQQGRRAARRSAGSDRPPSNSPAARTPPPTPRTRCCRARPAVAGEPAGPESEPDRWLVVGTWP
jgi:hypothetical protein